MLLREDGKIIEIRVSDEDPPDSFRRNGDRPGIFPETIVVKRRNANGETERHEYVPKKQPTVIHVDGYDDELPEADKLSYAIAFVKKAPTSNDDDVYGSEIALFVLSAYLASLPEKEIVDE